MINALKPCGVLLCEELDEQTVDLVSPADARARKLYRAVEGAIATTMGAQGHAYDFGRQLPARLRANGLVELGGEGQLL